MVSNTYALTILPPVKASNSSELFYMLVLQNSLKHELDMTYTALSNSPKTGKIEIYRKMKLCDLDKLYTHQKEFYSLNKAFYKNDVKQFVDEINVKQKENKKIMVDNCKLLEKEYFNE